MTKIEGDRLFPRYNIVVTGCRGRPGQLVFHTIRFYLIVEANNSGMVELLLVQYGAITSTVRLCSFPITCTVFLQLPLPY